MKVDFESVGVRRAASTESSIRLRRSLKSRSNFSPDRSEVGLETVDFQWTIVGESDPAVTAGIESFKTTKQSVDLGW